MFERIKISKINDHIWLLNDNNEATGYLVAGKEKALVIDTMIGYEDVHAVVRTLTDLPLVVVNTHGHCDHIYGNIYFEDSTYGKIRIVAADSNIPCGTVVQITNVSFSTEPIIAIVLDRGGAIKGNIMDFLVSETDNMDVIGRQKEVHYETLRWGW